MNRSARSTNQCSFILTTRGLGESSRCRCQSRVWKSRVFDRLHSSGSCASWTLFMDRARPARYLHPRYEDEKSGDRDLISAVADLSRAGWLGLRKIYPRAHYFFSCLLCCLAWMLIYRAHRSLSFSQRRQLVKSLPTTDDLSLRIVIFLFFDLRSINFERLASFSFRLSKEFVATAVVSMKICFPRWMFTFNLPKWLTDGPYAWAAI